MIGVCISKIYKKGKDLVINLPYEVIETLRLNEGEELEFFKYSEKYFLIAKKNDILDLLLSKRQLPEAKAGIEQHAEQAPEGKATASESKAAALEVSRGELAVLKKLDTLRYNERTRSNVKSILSQEEGSILQSLLKRGYVKLFKKEGDTDYRYSIPKDIYNAFLFGKRNVPVEKEKESQKGAEQDQHIVKLKESNKYSDELEAKGFLVISSEPEATMLSTMLEESIRQGLVVGTRAFDKKFYIAVKAFVASNTQKLLSIISASGKRIDEIASEANMDEDAVRTILYILAEDGDVTEVRKDFFKAA